MSLASEPSSVNSQHSSRPARASESEIIPGAYKFEERASESEFECPTPSNKGVVLPEPTDNTEPTDKEKESLGPLEDPLAVPAATELVADPDFCFDDSNITLKVEKHIFRVHAFKLKEFNNIKPLIEDTQKDLEGCKRVELVGSADDFHNVFTILYSSAYDPQIFDATVLKSTLRLSAIHDHPKLRIFAIQKLEQLEILPIERFALSRDCNIESWMSTALDDLSQRREPITADEAEVLGARKLAELAARREQLISDRWYRRHERHLTVSVKSTPPDIPKPFSLGGTGGDFNSPGITGGLFGAKWDTSMSTAGAAAQPATGLFGTTVGMVSAVGRGTTSPPFAATEEFDSPYGGVTLQVHYQSITMMPAYSTLSFEELRAQDYAIGRKNPATSGPWQQSTFGTSAAFSNSCFTLPPKGASSATV
ncbi:hypothetical protein BDV93DRAFT_524272 [Ceratobasidium sp. AG-I]|nr:hypothetical protein BDV93DRAFT_524272 [Ceratobasidium sp. AG-I]